MTFQPWNEFEEAKLRECVEARMSPTEIAKLLGRGVRAIYRKTDSMKFRPEGYIKPRNFWTEERTAQLRTLFAQGLSARQISEAMGCTRNSIIGRSGRLGLIWTFPIYTPEERAQRQRQSKQRYKERKRAVYAALRASLPPMQRKAKSTVRKPINDLFDQALHIGLLDLERQQCRYPYGDSPFTFCGHPQTPGSSYCANHEAFCHGYEPLKKVENHPSRRIWASA